MKELIDKFKKIEHSISGEKGEFELFGLFLRDDAPDKWDLVISSEWARQNIKDSLYFLVAEIKKEITKEEMLKLSRLVILDKDDAALNALQSAMHVEHGLAEIRDSNFMGLAIKHAYIITSARIREEGVSD